MANNQSNPGCQINCEIRQSPPRGSGRPATVDLSPTLASHVWPGRTAPRRSERAWFSDDLANRPTLGRSASSMTTEELGRPNPRRRQLGWIQWEFSGAPSAAVATHRFEFAHAVTPAGTPNRAAILGREEFHAQRANARIAMGRKHKQHESGDSRARGERQSPGQLRYPPGGSPTRDQQALQLPSTAGPADRARRKRWPRARTQE